MKQHRPQPMKAPELSLDPSVVLVVPADSHTDRSVLKPEEQLLMALADGQASISEMVRLSGLSGSVTVKVLRSLCERGLLEPRGGAPRPAPRLTQDLSELVKDLSGEGRGRPEEQGHVEGRRPVVSAKATLL